MEQPLSNTSISSAFDQGSFKDPVGSVRVYADHVERTCREQSIGEVKAFLSSALFRKLVDRGLLLAAHWDDRSATVQQPLIKDWSYPFEWSFSMLRDAALATLEIQRECLRAKMSLKDAAAYNLTFSQGRPIFVDIYSFEQFEPSLAWNGYDQFCREFLNPLILERQTGLAFQKVFRSYLNGIPTEELAKLLPLHRQLRPGYFSHVFLKNKLEQSFARPASGRTGVTRELKTSSEIASEIQLKLCDRLERMLKKVEPPRSPTEWSDYRAIRTYSSDSLTTKINALRAFFEQDSNQSLIDYGCNDGEFSKLAASHYEKVLAVDIDPACIDRLYREQLAGQAPKNITMLIQDLSNPSPALGWNYQERKSFHQRFKTDSFLALALVHHLRFTANIPTEHFIRNFAENHRAGIIEYVGLGDSMVKHLLRSRPTFDTADYKTECFIEIVRQHFTVEEIISISDERQLIRVKR